MSDRSPRFDEEEIRRLLADARAREPMPDDVAGRLDDVLVGLAGEQATAEVVPLARRRRPARLLLAAAAAAVVVGGSAVTVQQLSGQGSDSAADTSATSLRADSDAAEDGGGARDSGGVAEAAPTPAPTPAPTRESGSAAKSYDAQQLDSLTAMPPLLSTTHFARDARDLLAAGADTPAPASGASSFKTPAPHCASPLAMRTTTGTRVLAVRVDDAPAWLLVGPAEGTPASRVVAAWSCDGTVRLARAVVPEK